MRLLTCLIPFVFGAQTLAQPILRDSIGTPVCDSLVARILACPAEKLAAPQARRAWQTPDSPAELHLREILSGQPLIPAERQRYRSFHLLPPDPRLDYEQNCAELSDGLPEGC